MHTLGIVTLALALFGATRLVLVLGRAGARFGRAFGASWRTESRVPGARARVARAVPSASQTNLRIPVIKD